MNATTPVAEPQYAAPPPSNPQPAGQPEPDYIGELKSLADLRDAGVLTNEEFEAKKQQILGR